MKLAVKESPGANHTYPSGPEGRTIYAVGDIHGRLDLLEKIHAVIDADKKSDTSTRFTEIYLGDYIDRGPNPAGVISRLIERARSTEAVFVRGNHEQYLLDFLDGANCLEVWKAFGGISTFRSYQLEPALLARDAQEDAVRAALASKLPADHRQFFANTSSYCDAKPYLFVHAGIKPGVKLEVQALTDLLTIRAEFLDFGGDFGRVVVHGHTPVMDPDLRPNRINVDTGAFATHRLTCLKIDQVGARVLSS